MNDLLNELNNLYSNLNEQCQKCFLQRSLTPLSRVI